ncbi:gfo/Idh/MocA family oxidoreductase, partial [candidate division KSB3 bacterium]|nr:gfo/Idh/MocA family oxidoreductase [candidate division KSB3 bacterium]MBD3323631.1 gfo/Idh/MocA family oxidoreductase [candidate division KSB3 bacterium]
MAKEKLGIGFIGAGEISILHGIALREIPNAELIGLWNRTPERAVNRAKEEQCIRYDTPEDLVKDPAIDAVIINTNQETHLKYARLVMEAGKHVLVEKPLATTVADVEEMKAISEKTGRLCVPGHNMIHEESIKRAHKLVKHGDLGPLVSCYVMYNIQHSEERASTLPGVVRHIFTHNLYTLMYLTCSKPVRVSGFKTMLHYEHIDKEDITLVNLVLENGALGHICSSFAADDLSPSPWTYTAKVIGLAGSTHYTYNDWVEVKKGISHSHTYTAYQATITNEDQ